MGGWEKKAGGCCQSCSWTRNALMPTPGNEEGKHSALALLGAYIARWKSGSAPDWTTGYDVDNYPPPQRRTAEPSQPHSSPTLNLENRGFPNHKTFSGEVLACFSCTYRSTWLNLLTLMFFSALLTSFGQAFNVFHLTLLQSTRKTDLKTISRHLVLFSEALKCQQLTNKPLLHLKLRKLFLIDQCGLTRAHIKYKYSLMETLNC